MEEQLQVEQPVVAEETQETTQEENKVYLWCFPT